MTLSRWATPRNLQTSSAFSSHSTTFWVESPLNSGISRSSIALSTIVCRNSLLEQRKCDKQQRLYTQGLIFTAHTNTSTLFAPNSPSPSVTTHLPVHLITPGNMPTFQSQSPISPRPAHIECHTNNLASSCSHLTYSVSNLFTSLHVYHTLLIMRQEIIIQVNCLLPEKRHFDHDLRRGNMYPLPVTRTNRYKKSLIPWGLYHWQ